MSPVLPLRATRPVALVGAGPTSPGGLARALALAAEAVAADGGGDVALPQGRRFASVIGDLDSLRSAEALGRDGVPVHHLPEQETTDFEKCLYSVEAPLYLAVGFVGGRIDHDLAAINALVKYPRKRVVLIGPRDICFLCPPLLEVAAPKGTRVSLFPMGPARGVISEGLRWPVAGLALAPGGRTGTSNEALGGRIRVGFDAPCVLAILPLGMLDQVAALLLAKGGADAGELA